MKIIRIFYLQLLLCYLCLLSSLQSQTVKIDSLLTLYADEGLFNGVVLVAHKNKIVYQKAFGFANREWKIPMTINTKFKIGSVSKPFTALLILQLTEAGYISLDDTLGHFLEDFKGTGKSKITIRQLLRHTSGIRNSIPEENEKIRERQIHSLEDLKDYTKKAPLYFEAGSGFRYSNLGYNLLALIAQIVMKQPFEILLHRHIFDPIKMNDTKNDLDLLIEERLAKGYEYDLLNGYMNTTYFDNSYITGAGGITTTAGDLYKWYLALQDESGLISEETKKEMYSPSHLGPYGYGWFIRKETQYDLADTLKIIEHSGSINGFGSYFAQIPADSAVVIVLKNSRAHNYIRPLFAPVLGKQIISIICNRHFTIPVKSIAIHLARVIGLSGVENVAETYYNLKNNVYYEYTFDESELNKLGIELLFTYNRIDDALGIFLLNIREFPQSYNVYDSYAYALMQKKDYKNAINYYKKGLEILKENPKQDNPSLEKDVKNALMYIKEMEENLSKVEK